MRAVTLRSCVLAFAAITLLTGCPVPIIVPPVQVMAGGGFQAVDGLPPAPPPTRTTSVGPDGRVITQVGPSAPKDNGPAFQFRAGLYPLQLGKGWQKRNFDVGVGYAFDSGPALKLHNAFIEGSFIPGVTSLGQDSYARAGLRTQIRLAYEPESDRFGRGAAVQLFGEVGTFVSNDPHKKRSKIEERIWCFALGELGAGAYAEVSYTRVGDLTVYTVGGGLSFRIPALLGMAIIWPWEIAAAFLKSR